MRPRLDLEAIKKRVEDALPGPWYAMFGNDVSADDEHGTYRIACCDMPNAKANAAFITHAREDIPALIAEVERLRGIIAQHELCHDLHGKVNAEDFAKGCAAEQRRIYGCAPHADEIRDARELLSRCRDYFNGKGELIPLIADLRIMLGPLKDSADPAPGDTLGDTSENPETASDANQAKQAT